VKERTLFTVIILSLVLLAVGYLVATQVDLSWLMPEQASTRAVQVDRLFRVMMGIAVVIFLIVEGALVYAVLRFRRKPDDEREGLPVHGNNTLEVVWTIIPAIIVAVIGIYSYQVLTDVERKPEDPLVVRVIGQQFVWSFEYPESGIKSNVLHLPVDQPVQFQIESRDVIHSFWVPAFRVKHDATPGQIDELIITPTEIGTFPVRCAELCGAGHAAMITEVKVESAQDFQDWIDSGGQELASVPGTEGGQGEQTASVAGGAELFVQFGCGACHTLTDASTAGIVGPALDGIGTWGADRVEGQDAATYIRNSIIQPNAYIEQGYPQDVMPQDFVTRTTPEQLDVLVSYLSAQ
jgi:cytochrome c oxidase subunit 2